jgi:hypothetical protein
MKTIAGIIKTMWGALGRAWLDHLDTIHQKSKCAQSPVTLESLQTRVRLIHAMKSETLRIHHHYFHEDLDRVLQKATIQSLQTYIQHYLLAILQSINQRSDQQKTLKIPSPLGSPIPPSPRSNHVPILRQLRPHSAQEEPSHRKHSRRRIG